MRHGVDVCTLGELADPGLVVELAVAAEDAGWEALFVWDHLAFAWGVPSAEPWTVLAAVAQATSRIRLGTAVTPVPRRRPVVLAATVATLDRLSGGRVVFGAGLGGVPVEFSAFGDPDDAAVRAARLDEGLDVLAALWSGQPVHHTGTHYRVDGVSLAPLPVQRPRVPVWIGGHGRPARRRAARWDGWLIGGDDERGRMRMPPARVAAGLADIHAQRGAAGRDGDGPAGGGFDLAMTGVSAGPDDAVFDGYARAGVTWWLEHLHGRRGSVADLRARVEAGPPR